MKDIKKMKSGLAAAMKMREETLSHLAVVNDLIAGLEEAISEAGTATNGSSMLYENSHQAGLNNIPEDDNNWA